MYKNFNTDRLGSQVFSDERRKEVNEAKHGREVAAIVDGPTNPDWQDIEQFTLSLGEIE